MRDAASQRQVDAARPDRSTWLSANAGSGKTRVLTDRVARLLLSGVDPARILCLTYTKAAASEMQNRLFARLGAWAMTPEPDLRSALAELGIEGEVSRETLDQARRLFARAIETPGGLRIQTIHSFCAMILRRFPLEAGVSPQFTEMDDRASRLLREEILEEMADSLAPQIMSDLARCHSGQDFMQLAAEVIRNADGFAPARAPDQLARALGLQGEETPQSIVASVVLGDEVLWLPEAISVIAGGTPTDQKTADRLAALDFSQPDLDLVAALESFMLYGATAKAPFGAKVGSLPTKAIRAALGPLADKLDDLMRRVEDARPRRLALLAAQRSIVLHQFAQAFLPIYAHRKTLRGALDFDDLILRAKALLTDPAVAQWVLFRLDGGIDHILVDEAQDTSPQQWNVIELLAQEFTSGKGARDVERTIFVVGDQKQSIYSFQGADVTAFASMRDAFAERLNAVGAPFQRLELEHSFRSSPLILDLVDKTFPPQIHPALGGPSQHLAFRSSMPGRVEIWPPIPPASNPADDDWSNPVDLVTSEHHAASLGRQVAERIGQILSSGILIPDGKGARPVHSGDFLVLVRRRSALFAEIIRACKEAGLPIAGADRLHLGGEMAVKDLTSLLAFLALPEDDLALAEVLRSPLFGWSEAQLYDLAQPRRGYLWEALRQYEPGADDVAILQDLRDNADYLRPFDLIERALTRHDGRRKLLARLGSEAEDGINELLTQALIYERNDVPSLTGFLTWLQADDVQIKRQMESAGRKIRVMTVHGAKGLEAPIVILPDTADARPNDRDEVLRLGPHAVWRTPSAESPAQIDAVRRARADRAQAESMRLLYVALTRAQSWLIVAAAGALASQKAGATEGEPAWYDLVRNGALAIGASLRPDGVLACEFGTWECATPEHEPVGAPEVQLPHWTATPAPAAQQPEKPVSPSDLGGAKALPGEGEGGEVHGVDRGTALHALLELMEPDAPDLWPIIARSLIDEPAARAELLAEATRLLSDPALQHVFAPDTLREVEVTAPHQGKRLLGKIDRLIVQPDHVLIVDFKSNRAVPDHPGAIPEGLVRQMRAYADAMRQIYPDRRVDCAILWTRTGTLMAVPV
ncbi:MAG: double-strand break repair helicase AddA [Gemmobacter sp.]